MRKWTYQLIAAIHTKSHYLAYIVWFYLILCNSNILCNFITALLYFDFMFSLVSMCLLFFPFIVCLSHHIKIDLTWLNCEIFSKYYCILDCNTFALLCFCTFTLVSPVISLTFTVGFCKKIGRWLVCFFMVHLFFYGLSISNRDRIKCVNWWSV